MKPAPSARLVASRVIYIIELILNRASDLLTPDPPPIFVLDWRLCYVTGPQGFLHTRPPPITYKAHTHT